MHVNTCMWRATVPILLLHLAADLAAATHRLHAAAVDCCGAANPAPAAAGAVAAAYSAAAALAAVSAAIPPEPALTTVPSGSGPARHTPDPNTYHAGCSQPA